jgi:hypothetical protein
MKRHFALFVIIFAILASACNPVSTPIAASPTISATKAIPTATPTVTPTSTPAPTATPVLATSAQEIVGIWKKKRPVGVDEFLQFEEDGTMTFARGKPENLQSQPFRVAEFTFEGMQLLIHPGTVAWPNPEEVCIKETGIYEAQLLENGDLHLFVIQDTCISQVNALEAEWTSLTPGN